MHNTTTKRRLDPINERNTVYSNKEINSAGDNKISKSEDFSIISESKINNHHHHNKKTNDDITNKNSTSKSTNSITKNKRKGPGRPRGSLNKATIERIKAEEEAIKLFRLSNPDIPSYNIVDYSHNENNVQAHDYNTNNDKDKDSVDQRRDSHDREVKRDYYDGSYPGINSSYPIINEQQINNYNNNHNNISNENNIINVNEQNKMYNYKSQIQTQLQPVMAIPINGNMIDTFNRPPIEMIQPAPIVYDSNESRMRNAYQQQMLIRQQYQQQPTQQIQPPPQIQQSQSPQPQQQQQQQLPPPPLSVPATVQIQYPPQAPIQVQYPPQQQQRQQSLIPMSQPYETSHYVPIVTYPPNTTASAIYQTPQNVPGILFNTPVYSKAYYQPMIPKYPQSTQNIPEPIQEKNSQDKDGKYGEYNEKRISIPGGDTPKSTIAKIEDDSNNYEERPSNLTDSRYSSSSNSWSKYSSYSLPPNYFNSSQNLIAGPNMVQYTPFPTPPKYPLYTSQEILIKYPSADSNINPSTNPTTANSDTVQRPIPTISQQQSSLYSSQSSFPSSTIKTINEDEYNEQTSNRNVIYLSNTEDSSHSNNDYANSNNRPTLGTNSNTSYVAVPVSVPIPVTAVPASVSLPAPMNSIPPPPNINYNSNFTNPYSNRRYGSHSSTDLNNNKVQYVRTEYTPYGYNDSINKTGNGVGNSTSNSTENANFDRSTTDGGNNDINVDNVR